MNREIETIPQVSVLRPKKPLLVNLVLITMAPLLPFLVCKALGKPIFSVRYSCIPGVRLANVIIPRAEEKSFEVL